MPKAKNVCLPASRTPGSGFRFLESKTSENRQRTHHGAQDLGNPISRTCKILSFTIQDGQVVHAANPQRQTHRRGPQSVFALRNGERKIDRLENSRANAFRPDQLDQGPRPPFLIAPAIKSAEGIATGLPAGPRPAASGPDFIFKWPTAPVESGRQRRKSVARPQSRLLPEDLPRNESPPKAFLTVREAESARTPHSSAPSKWAKSCVCGAAALSIDYHAKTLTVSGKTFGEGGDFLSIDGTSGIVYAGPSENGGRAK